MNFFAAFIPTFVCETSRRIYIFNKCDWVPKKNNVYEFSRFSLFLNVLIIFSVIINSAALVDCLLAPSTKKSQKGFFHYLWRETWHLGDDVFNPMFWNGF